VTLTYSKWSPPDAVPEVEKHVRAHLSAVAAPDDDEAAHFDEVRIRHEDPPADVDEARIRHDDPDGEGVLVIGELDAEPVASYLRAGFTPEQDIAANPLTVESIEEQP